MITDFILGEDVFGGQDVLVTVRNIRPNCPVILLTGYFKHMDSQKGKKHEFSYIAQKPVDFAKISQIISRFSKKEINVDVVNKNKSPKIFDHDY